MFALQLEHLPRLLRALLWQSLSCERSSSATQGDTVE